MTTEFEATFMDADHEALRTKLQACGATLTQAETLMRRLNFDFPDLRLDAQAAWLRLRDEGHTYTLTYKQRTDETIEGMKEIEVEVSDFEETQKLLQALGMSIKSEQETKREVWQLDSCQIMLDTWPWIPPFAEVEGPDEKSVRAASGKLGFNYNQALFDSVDAIYGRHFDVTRTEISSIPIKFGPVPATLEAKRR